MLLKTDEQSSDEGKEYEDGDHGQKDSRGRGKGRQGEVDVGHGERHLRNGCWQTDFEEHDDDGDSSSTSKCSKLNLR